MSGRAAPALLLAALALQGAIAALGLPPAGRALAGDEQMYVAMAGDWASGRPVEIDPLWPPGYPALLAGWLAVGGGLLGFLPLQILAHLAAAGLLARVAWRLTGDSRVASLAAALFALDPQVAAFAQTFWPETLHLALLLLLLVLSVEGIGRDAAALAFGAAAGAALLLKSLLTPLVPLLLLGAIAGGRPGGRVRRLGLALVALTLVVSPVLFANHRRHGFWGIADSTRFNLALGLADRSPRSLRDDRAYPFLLEYRAAGESFAERQAALAERLRRDVAARGAATILSDRLPRQYFRLFDRESYFAAMLPPAGALASLGQGFRHPPSWLASGLALFGLAVYAAILASAPLGLALLASRGSHRLWPLLALLSYQLAIFVLLHVKARYRLPLLPVLDVAAATAWVGLARKAGGDAKDALGGWVWGGGLAGGAVLLLFGFGADLFG